MARTIHIHAHRGDGLPLLIHPICGWQNDLEDDSMMDRTTKEFLCRYSFMPNHLSTRMEEMEADYKIRHVSISNRRHIFRNTHNVPSLDLLVSLGSKHDNWLPPRDDTDMCDTGIITTITKS
jgi:hypothetical protein